MRTPGCASLALLLAAVGCPRHVPVEPGVEREVRVGLGVGLDRVTLGSRAGGELFLTNEGSGEPVGAIPVGVTWVAVPESGGLRLVRPDGSTTDRYRSLAVVSVTEGRFTVANGRRYRGRVHLVRDAAGLTVINRVALESYVAGVIGGEMGRRRDDEVEAMLAQAVVSRTVALRNRGRWEMHGFDVWGDVRDQAYGGVDGETPAVWEAVRRTAGQVLRYKGEVIDAFFHSTCGYRTAGVEEAFGAARSRPYLRPVSDARGGGKYYCDISPRFRWREEWDAAKLRTILSRTLPSVAAVDGDGLQRITDVEVSRTTPSGRVAELRIVLARGDVRVPGPDVRQVLRPEPDRWLGSLAFQLQVTRQGGGVARVVAAGAGWGHGVGLCQWGAVGRARAGQSYRQILATYFPGTTVERL